MSAYVKTHWKFLYVNKYKSERKGCSVEKKKHFLENQETF